MNLNYLPPLLRGIGTTIVLVATMVSVMVARDNLRADQTRRDAVRAKAEADAKAEPVATRNLAELTVEVRNFQSEVEEDTIVVEMIDNPWFNYAGFLGMATIASSFFAETALRRREKV